MPKKLLATTILTAILVLVISVQVVEVVKANPIIPYPTTPNKEKPTVEVQLPQNYSTYNDSCISYNFIVTQPKSWNFVYMIWHCIGELNSVDVYLDGNLTIHYSTDNIYLNGNMSRFPKTTETYTFRFIDWINHTTPGQHVLNITVLSQTYNIGEAYVGNHTYGRTDGKVIYSYPIIVSDVAYFTVEQQQPSPSTMPSLATDLLSNPMSLLAIGSVIVIIIITIASVSLVYFKRRGKMKS
jgi:hypothetical protein